MRRTVLAALAVGVLVAGALVLAGLWTRGPLADRLGFETTEVTPEFASPLEPPGDPLVLIVMFPWDEEGFCSGQFTASATEEPGRVVVSQVVSRWPRGGAVCAGLGTANGRAVVHVTLSQPLGSRTVWREVDGRQLPVRTGR